MPAARSSTRLQTLRARVNGRVFVPGDDGYDTARQTWNVTTFDQRPAIVVMPSTAADVASAVGFAREHNLPIAAQGGGHGHPHPADDALLVNFANMTHVHIAGDRAAGIFLVEARHAGGALARQPEQAMPFGFRSPWFVSALAAAPTPRVLEGGRQSVAALFEALEPALTGEVLINGLDAGNTGAHLTRAAYSEANYRKLVALKDKYDPANFFRFNHNIAPSTPL
jgi:FAD/FMN-containing dehydrogenase